MTAKNLHKVTVNNQTFEVTDDIALQIMLLLTKAPTSKKSSTSPKTISAPTDLADIKWVCDGNKVSYTDKDGKFIPQKDIREVLNAHIKACGGTWDKDAKSWVFMNGSKKSNKKAQECVSSAPTTVSAEARQQVRDKWASRKAK